MKYILTIVLAGICIFSSGCRESDIEAGKTSTGIENMLKKNFGASAVSVQFHKTYDKIFVAELSFNDGSRKSFSGGIGTSVDQVIAIEEAQMNATTGATLFSLGKFQEEDAIPRALCSGLTTLEPLVAEGRDGYTAWVIVDNETVSCN